MRWRYAVIFPAGKRPAILKFKFRIGGESRGGYIGNNMVTSTWLYRTGSLSGDSKDMVSFKKSNMQFSKSSWNTNRIFLLQLPKRGREFLDTGCPVDTRDEGWVFLLPLEDKGQMHPNQQMKCRRREKIYMSSNKLWSLDCKLTCDAGKCSLINL